jgi:hypothetical protein
MNCVDNAKRISLILLPLLLTLALLSCNGSADVTYYGSADSTHAEADFIGTWTGVMEMAPQDNPVDLSVTAAEGASSAISYNFHYGPTRSCWLNAVKVKLEGNVLTLVFDEASGGYCDRLWRGNMALELLDENRLTVKIYKPGSGIQQETLLKKQH